MAEINPMVRGAAEGAPTRLPRESTGKTMSTISDQPSDGRALRNGEFASPLGYPATKAAKRLVNDVYARVAADQREHTKTKANENKLWLAYAPVPTIILDGNDNH